MSFKQIIKSYLTKKRRRKFQKISVLNSDISILCNCCIGGAMYHDIGQKFLSPTINLYFAHHCFIDYVLNLREYTLHGKLVNSQKKESVNGAPIGLLVCNNLPDIEIHFLHYNSFEEAKTKWEERSKRINFKKIFLLIEAKDYHEHDLLNEYVSLPYKKVIFTNFISDMSNSILKMPFYSRHPKGNITSFVGISGKKGYDDFDFINQIFNRSDW